MPLTDTHPKLKKPAPRWDLDSIFPGGSSSNDYKVFREEIRNDLAQARTDFAGLTELLGPTNESNWRDLILDFQRLGERLELARSFANCLISQNVKDDLAYAIFGEVDAILAEWLSLKSSLSFWGAKQSEANWERFTSLPELVPIKFPLDEMRRDAKDKMSPELEALALELAVNGYHAWARFYDKLSGEIKVEYKENGKSEILSVGQLQTKFNSPDRSVRRNAFMLFEKGWHEKASLAAAALNAQGGYRLSLYKNRRWNSVLHEPLKMNRLREVTLDAMWRSVESALPALKKYVEAKKRSLGIDKFCWYDQFAPVGKLDLEFSFDEAGDFIVKHLGTFSEEMSRFSQMALEKQWVEGEDRPGKGDGGFCTGMGPKQETRIFMTCSDDFGSMTTLAHELGHAYHQWVLKETPFFATEYPMGLAETASIFNELRVIDAALQEVTNPQQKLMLLDQVLQQAYILFCNIYARFIFDKAFYAERARGIVGRQRLDELMVAAQKKAFGGTLDPQEGHHPLFWASKLHFYYTEAPFYNFPYTFGFLFATGVYEKALREGKSFAPKYKELLKDTGSMTTEEVAAKHLGVDLAKDDFWKRAVGMAISRADEFCRLVDTKS